MVQSRWMRRRNGGLIRFLAVLSLVVAAGVTAPAAGQPRIDSDRLAFRLQDLDGNLVSAEDPAFEGKVLLVDIWGTWCPPCISSIPVFSRLQEEWGGQGLVVLGIAFERKDADQAVDHLRRFSRQQGINYRVLYGGTPGQVMEKLPGLRDFQAFPVEILIDREGRVASVRNAKGYSKRWEKRLRRELSELLHPEAGP